MLNKIQLIGHLGKDPEVKEVNGKSVYTFTVATSDTYKDKSGERVTQTEWHNVVAWGLKICEYLSKGSLVYLEGKKQTRSYERDGHKKFITEVIARDIKPLTKFDNAKAEFDNAKDDLPF